MLAGVRIWGLLIVCGVAVATALVLAPTSGAHGRGSYWPMVKVMRAVDGARLPIGGRALRVKAATTLCSGEGRSTRRRGARAWKHFRCTFTTEGGFGRDVEFRVHPLDARRFRLTDARWVGA